MIARRDTALELLRRDDIRIYLEPNPVRHFSYSRGDLSQSFSAYHKHIAVAIRALASLGARTIYEHDIVIAVGERLTQGGFRPRSLLNQFSQRGIQRRIDIGTVINPVPVLLCPQKTDLDQSLGLAHQAWCAQSRVPGQFAYMNPALSAVKQRRKQGNLTL